jgi:hypothetical protein
MMTAQLVRMLNSRGVQIGISYNHGPIGGEAPLFQIFVQQMNYFVFAEPLKSLEG